MAKNLQSIQNQTRFEDFMVEIDDGDFDIHFLAETWRAEKEAFYKTNGGHNLFLSGSPLGHVGVGICISKILCYVPCIFGSSVPYTNWTREIPDFCMLFSHCIGSRLRPGRCI